MNADLGALLLSSVLLACGAEPRAGAATERAARDAARPAADAGSPAENGAYAFLVAGHVYGKPGGDTLGLHPPLKERMPWILEQPGIAFAVFAGDVVRRPNARYWDPAARDIADLGLPVHLVAGNHDIAYEGAQGRDDLVFRADYEERFGPTFYAFRHAGDLFLVLDTTLDHWNISGEQRELVERELAGDPFRNLFVFTHHLVWWRPSDEPGLRPNSLDGRNRGRPDFWPSIAPKLRAVGRDVYLFAGDLGAHDKATAFAYRREGSLHFVGTGMGEGTRDNCVVVEVAPDGEVELRLVALQGEPDSLGALR